MNDTRIMNVFDCFENGTNEGRGITNGKVIRINTWALDGYLRFIIVSLGAYPIEELSARAEIETEIEVVRGLIRQVQA